MLALTTAPETVTGTLTAAPLIATTAPIMKIPKEKPSRRA